MNLALEAIKLEVEKNVSKVLVGLEGDLMLKSRRVEFCWSEELKGHKVKISGMVAEQTNMESSGQRFAMI